MEHFYKSIYGWFNYEYLYKEMIDTLPNGSRIVEIGSYKGKSTAFLAVELINSGKDIELNIIDSWNGSDGTTRAPWSDYIDEPHNGAKKPRGDIFEEFKKNLESVWHVINPIQSLSGPAASLFEDKSVDFIFIDGNHHYEGVKEDLVKWRPKMKDGATMSGDDYNPSWGVIKAVDEFFGKNRVIATPFSQWVVKL
jgi:hypothetical protein